MPAAAVGGEAVKQFSFTATEAALEWCRSSGRWPTVAAILRRIVPELAAELGIDVPDEILLTLDGRGRAMGRWLDRKKAVEINLSWLPRPERGDDELEDHLRFVVAHELSHARDAARGVEYDLDLSRLPAGVDMEMYALVSACEARAYYVSARYSKRGRHYLRAILKFANQPGTGELLEWFRSEYLKR